MYSAALQLREAIRLKIGREATECLAIPQPNENGDVIDWYAPTAGDVVPWSAATPEERSSAFAQLEHLHQRLRGYSQQMRSEEQSREKQLFGRLLEKALYFPDPSHLYLVEGKPVVSFWGFASRNAPEAQDPLLGLRPVVPAAAAPALEIPTVAPAASAAGPTASVIVEPVRRRWGWLWTLLGLLLLLLLLLFLMRACVPTVTLPFGLSQIELPGLPPAKEEPKLLPDGTVVEDPVWWRTGVVGSVVNAVTGTDTTEAAPVATPEASALGKDAALADKAALDAASKEGLVPPPEANADNKANPEGQNPKDPASAPEQPKGANDPNKGQTPQPPKDLLGSDPKANANNPANKDGQKNTPPVPPELQDKAAGGKPLNIPADAAKAGSTEFLDGSWKAGSGIQDARTGKPMQLDYRFEDGKGQVVVRGSNGLECKGAVNANMHGGQLAISNQGQATCNDGSQYKLPEVTCAPGSSSADCTGRYGNQQFPLSMKQGSQ